ncbi:unnamed protein product [Rhizopus stolonifer]
MAPQSRDTTESSDDTTYPLPPLSIGIIAIVSVITASFLLYLVFFLTKRKRNQNNIENPAAKKHNKKLLQLFKPSPTLTTAPPKISSLDSNDIFSSLLEYPPSIIPPKSTGPSENDPISLSLARQKKDQRAGYYKSPSRTFVPYYCNQSTTLTCPNNITRDDDDDDTKAMQRWSASSYHVW